MNKNPGIIILGNAGSGKSFLCNVLLDRIRFDSEFKPTAVTTETEQEIIGIYGKTFSIFNVPGLIEDDQERIDLNKKEIEKAFQRCPNSIVIFVWAPNTGGRVSPNDGIAFSALHQAYEYQPTSVIYVINNVPSNRPSTYDAAFLVQIEQALSRNGLHITPDDSVFVEWTDFHNLEKRRAVQQKLFRSIVRHKPETYVKKNEIIVETARVKALIQEFKRQPAEAQKDQEKYRNEIEEMKRKLAAAEASRTPDTFLGALSAGTRTGAHAAGVVVGAVGATLLAPGYALAEKIEEWWDS